MVQRHGKYLEIAFYVLQGSAFPLLAFHVHKMEK